MVVSGQQHAPATLPRKRHSVPNDLKAQWAPEPVWNFRKEKSLAPARIGTPDRPGLSSATVVTTPSRLLLTLIITCRQKIKDGYLTFWRRNYFFFNFSTPVYKM